MYAFDPAIGRVVAISENPDLSSGVPLPGEFYDGAFLSDGSVFISSTFRTVERVGSPLHLLSQDGVIRLSFGDDPEGYRRGQNLDRAVAVSGDTLWSAHVSDYVIQAWTSSGELLFDFRRDADWFVPAAGPLRGDDPEPLSGVLDLHVRADGRLMVLLDIPDPRWREGIGRLEAPPGFVRTNWHRYVDTVLEVIDPQTRKVVARRKFDERIEQIVTDDRVASFHEETGIHIWRVVLPKNERDKDNEKPMDALNVPAGAGGV
jgi:hypothetical protein